ASDGERYRRGTDGIWRHDGQAAEGNLKLELEATRSALQPALAQHAEAMAAVQPRPALSPQERERADLAATYASHGISPDADTMAATVLAVQRTRQSHGIDAATTALAPQPNAQGGYDVTSALAHLYRDADDVVRVAAVTSSQDIRSALDEIQGRSITGPAAANSTGPCNDTRPEVAAGHRAPARGNRPLADDPAHPDFHTFDRIHTWVRGTGQWDEQQSRNVACALYRQQAGDPLVKRVDRVVGGLGRDGAENVFAVYAPFGDKGPFFHARVDGREASQQPARQNLEQAEQINQQAMQR